MPSSKSGEASKTPGRREPRSGEAVVVLLSPSSSTTTNLVYMNEETDNNEDEQEVKVSVNGNAVTVELVNSSPEAANALRVALHDSIPTMALDRFDVEANTSYMATPVLEQRLALIALKCNADHFEENPAHQTAYTPRNVLVFRLDVTNPSDKVTWVKADSLEFVPQTLKKNDAVEKPEVVHPDTPLLQLPPGGVVQLTAYAIKGTGAQHAKWSPVTLPTYTMDTDIEVLATTDEERKTLRDVCPQNVFEDLEDIKNTRCTQCRACIQTKPKPLATLTLNPTRFRLYFESLGVETPSVLIRKALRSIKQ